MNILYICDEYPPGRHGGIGTSVQLLAREMAAMGHTVVVAGFYDWGYGESDVFEDEGVKVYRFRRRFSAPWMGNLQNIAVKTVRKLLNISGLLEWDIKNSIKKYERFLRKLIADHKIDIAEIPDWQDYMRFCKTPVYFPQLPVPTLIKMNGSQTYFLREAGKEVPNYIYKVDHHLLVNATAVSGVSRYTAEKSAIYLDYHKPMGILHNGIAMPRIKGNVQKLQNRVIYTGSFLEKKGVFQLARAWNLVHEKLPQAELWMFGKGPVDEIKAELSAGAGKTVHINGHVSREELFRYLSESTVAIFPSYAECFALAPMEAMACGTAVIYSQRTSGPELVEHGVSGLLIDPDNITDIADNIIYLLTNSEACERLAQRGRKDVMEKFGIHIIAQKNLECYKRLINEYKNTRA